MLKNTNPGTIQNLTISGREFIAQGPTPTEHFSSYILTGPRGAAYLAVQAFRDEESVYKLLGGRNLNETWISGQQAFFQVQDDGSLREWSLNR